MTRHQPALTTPFMDGTQRLYRFPNGYGASVVNHQYAYGRHELAVIRFNSERLDDYGLTYDTPITDDVLGWLNDDTEAEALDAIATLPNPAEVSA